MEIPVTWWLIVGLSAALALTLWVTLQLHKNLRHERFRSRSQSTKYGNLTEQFLPLVDTYPWNPATFRFLGSPIDGVQFEDDRIILVEFKSGNSQLSKHQRKIRDLVLAGRVGFEVIRVG